MAPRAYWKGYLKLSLVSCPIALYPATSGREKISFNQLNKETGNRIRYRKVDAETGDDVEQSNIIKGYQVAKDQYIELLVHSASPKRRENETALAVTDTEWDAMVTVPDPRNRHQAPATPFPLT